MNLKRNTHLICICGTHNAMKSQNTRIQDMEYVIIIEVKSYTPENPKKEINTKEKYKKTLSR